VAGNGEVMIKGAIGKSALLHDMLKLNNRLLAPFSTHLAHRYRISLNEFRLLMAIGDKGRTASHEVAEITGVNVMSVSRAVATLQRHGRVEVVRDEANRRRKWLTLTEEGKRLYAVMRPQGFKVADYLFDGMDADDLATLADLVARLTCRLEAKDAGGGSAFLEATRPDGD
jgi:MarR family transcriptional regulator, lower aerobic nicotinate degradation pathway regulator